MLILGKSLSTSRLVSINFRPGPGMLCTKRPSKVKKECSFLVDFRRISLEDLRADGNPPYDKYDFFHTSFMFCQSVIYIQFYSCIQKYRAQKLISQPLLPLALLIIPVNLIVYTIREIILFTLLGLFLAFLKLCQTFQEQCEL